MELVAPERGARGAERRGDRRHCSRVPDRERIEGQEVEERLLPAHPAEGVLLACA